MVADGIVYFNGWAPGGDAGEQAQLPEFEQALKECDRNGDGRFTQDELPKPYQPTGSWRAIDLDNDGVLNARDWMFFRARRAAERADGWHCHDVEPEHRRGVEAGAIDGSD